MAAKLKVRVNAAAGGQEALCLTCRFEPMHLPFSSSCRLVRNLDPIVQIATLPVFDLWQQFSFGCRVALQLVRHDNPRHFGLTFDQFPEETFGRLRIPLFLHKDIEHGPILIDRAPQIVQLASDPDEHFI